MIQGYGIDRTISINLDVVLINNSIGRESRHCSHQSMESITCVGCKIGLCSIIVSVYGDFIFIVRIHNVGGNGFNPNGVSCIVAALGLMIPVQMRLTNRILFDKAHVTVG